MAKKIRKKQSSCWQRRLLSYLLLYGMEAGIMHDHLVLFKGVEKSRCHQKGILKKCKNKGLLGI